MAPSLDKTHGLSLKTKVIAATVVFVLIILGLESYQLRLDDSEDASRDFVREMLPAQEALLHADRAFGEARQGVHNYVVDGDEDEHGIPQYQQSLAAYEEHLTAARTALQSDDGDLIAQIDQIDEAVQAWRQQVAEPGIALRQNWTGSPEDLLTAVGAWVESPDSLAVTSQVDSGFAAAFDEIQASTDGRLRDMGKDDDRFALSFGLILASIAVLGAGFAGFLYRQIARPAARLVEAAEGIGAGDLASRTGIRQNDEIGVAAAAFDTMAERVQHLVANLERTQATLTDREARLTGILANVGEAILILSSEGKIVDANTAAQRMFDVGSEELVGRQADDFLPRPPDANTGGEFRELEAGPQVREFQATRASGERFPMEVTASRVRLDGVWHLILCIRDTSERVRAAQALQDEFRATERARRLTQSVIDAVSGAMLFFGLDDRVAVVNRRHAELLGVGEEDLLGRSIDEVRGIYEGILANAEPFVESISRPFGSGETERSIPLDQEWPSQRALKMIVLPVSGPDDDVVGRLCVIRDVTDELEADRMKSDFVSLVSHELRTPLTSIKGYVDLLLEGEVGSLTAEQADFLGIVAASSTRLVALTNDLLDMSRIEAGRLDLNPAPMEVAAQVRSVLATLRPQIEAKQQDLILDLPEALPPVQADHNRFAQVLTNLVSNAHKYTDEGGSITVRVRTEDGLARFEVIDTGAGLSIEEQQRLFTRFYRVRNRATQKQGGTGLGLAISKSLVEAQGGTIGIESAPGEGSTFFFTVPVVEGAAPIPTAPLASTARTASEPATVEEAERPRASVLPGRRTHGRVLIVEDEEDIALLFQRYLERAGYEAEIALNGEEALAKAITWHPELITLDIVLPDMDGFAVLEHLRADGRTGGIPVLFVSMLAASEPGQLLGAVDYLVKPVDERLLITRIRTILEGDADHLILVADDDEPTRGFLRERLTRSGYRIVEARDGWEALAVAARQPVSLALIDVRMPNLDGVETLRRLRNQARTAHLPVVMMTASPGMFDEHGMAIEQLGATLLLGKNLSAEDLADVISAKILPVGAAVGSGSAT